MLKQASQSTQYGAEASPDNSQTRPQLGKGFFLLGRTKKDSHYACLCLGYSPCSEEADKAEDVSCTREGTTTLDSYRLQHFSSGQTRQLSFLFLGNIYPAVNLPTVPRLFTDMRTDCKAIKPTASPDLSQASHI